MPPDSAVGTSDTAPTAKTATSAKSSEARDLVSVVLVEAAASSVTPFVPLPFVDDYIFARLLRRIARKVLARDANGTSDIVAKAIVEGYTRAGESSLGEKAVVAAARFIVRKVAVVLDVKKSHDVFGEAIAFALALDVAREHGVVRDVTALAVGAALFRSVQSVGSGPIGVLADAAKSAFTKTNEGATDGPESTRLARVTEAIGQKVDTTRAVLANVVPYELAAAKVS